MANEYFVVKNGLEVGSVSIDATTGNVSIPNGSSLTIGNTVISGSGVTNLSEISANNSKVIVNDTGTNSNVDIIVDGVRAVVVTGSAILPNSDQTYDLGSASLQWRDVYVGPGSLYINGQKVLQEDSGNIVVSCDADQNLSLQTSGDGNIEFDPTGSGLVAVKGVLQIQAGNNITSSDGNSVSFGAGIKTDNISSKTTDTDLILTANGTGAVRVSDNLVVTGNLTISGTTTTLNTATLSIADNIIDLNSDFTTGTPSENAGLRVMRGDSPAVQVQWNESTDKWGFTNDGTTYINIAASTTDLPEGTNLYYTSARFDTAFGTKSTTNLSEGTNLYYTSARFDTAFGTKSTTNLSEGTNLYYTNARARGAISAGTAISYNSSTGVISGNYTAGTGVGIASGTISIGQAVATSSNVTFATVTSTGAVSCPSITHTGTTGTGNIGSVSQTFGTVYATATSARYADLAEKYVADKELAPGTVVCFGGDKEVMECLSEHCTSVAGVVSTAPAYIMNAECQGEFVTTVAFTGRVPCKVIGPVRKGDMMVAAGNGAARAEANPKVGSVIGKALENFGGEAGVIEVVVGK